MNRHQARQGATRDSLERRKCRCNEIPITAILENHDLTDNFTITPKVLGDQELDHLDAAFCQTATEIPVTWTGI